jgi:RHS repeat-associated protein
MKVSFFALVGTLILLLSNVPDVIAQCPQISSVTKIQPSTCPNSTAQIGVVTATAGASYQVKRDGVNFGAPKVATSTSTPFWIVNTTSAGTYTVFASKSGCSTVQMNGSTVVSYTPTSVTGSISLSRSPTFCVGQTITLTATSGYSTYQWRRGGVNISGATSNVYTTGTEGTYSVFVTNTCGGSATWLGPPIAVNPSVTQPTITGGATSRCQGAGTTTYTATTSIGSLSWSILPSEAGMIDNSGNVSWSASFSGQATINVVSLGCNGPSSPASINVNVIPGINQSSVNKMQPSTCPNSNAQIGVVTSTAGATYQVKKDGINFGAPVNSPSAATPFWILNTTQAGTYTVVASKSGCGEVTMNGDVVVSYSDTPVSGSISSDRSPMFCIGQTITYTATPGYSTYQWRRNDVNIPGATANVYTTGTAGTYSVYVTNACGTSNVWYTAPVSVSPSVTQPSITGGATSRCQGTGTTTYTATTAVGTLSWSILPSTAGTISTNGTVTWSASFSETATISVVSTGCNGPSAPATRTVTIIPNVHVSAVTAVSIDNCPSHARICVVTAQEGATYQAKKNGVNFGQPKYFEPGSASTTLYTVVETTEQGSYTVEAYRAGCNPMPMSGTAEVAAPSPPPTGGISLPTSPFICPGGSKVLTATPGYKSYQWIKNGSNIPYENGTSYTVTEPGTYWVYVTNNCGLSSTWISPPISLSYTSITPATVTRCQGGPATQFAALTAGMPDATYSWSLTPGNAGSISSSGLATWNASFNGNATVTAAAAGCSPEAKGTASITVNIAPTAPTVKQPFYHTYNTPATLTALGAGENEGYHWYANLNDEVPLSSLITPPLTAETTTYYVTKYSTTTGCESFPRKPFIISIPANNYNWIKETTVLVKGIVDEADLADLQIQDSEKNILWKYFDDMGKPMQAVSVQASPSGQDVVQPMVYDNQGRNYRTYLPATVPESNGFYKRNPDIIDESSGNYKGIAAGFYNDPRPFHETVFEPSPLNRDVRSYGPGNEWKVYDKGIGHEYLHNRHDTGPSLTGEKIIAWTIGNNLPERMDAQSGYIEADGYYDDGQLTIERIKDENGNEVREYRDKEGKVVLKKVQAVTPVTSLNNNTEWALTYYVYDDFGNLRFVLQPELSALVLASDSYEPTAADLNKLSFQYKYDNRQRLIEKKVPGAEPLYMVYDRLGRLAMTQDGNQRRDLNTGAFTKTDWTFTKYDTWGRPIMTGIYTHPSVVDQEGMRVWLNTSTASFETYNGNAATHGYTNNALPVSNTQVLKVNYYDNYNFRNDLAGAANYSYTGDDLTEQEENENQHVNGLPVGSKTKLLDVSTDYLWNVLYYDQQYRTIQAKSQDHLNGINRVTNVYDFTRLKETMTTHNHGVTTYLQHSKNDYDHAGRLTRLQHKMGGESGFVVLLRNQYNEKGQLASKKLHSRDNEATFAQSIDYQYNIRGWLKKVNDPYAPEAGDLFNLEMKYNEPSAGTLQYNGNISELLWKSAGSDMQSYGYKYDVMYRLLEAKYHNLAKPVNNDRYTEYVGDGSSSRPAYDLNGNILNLIRHGKRSINFGITDNLSYAYGNGDNTLTSIDDIETDSGLDDGFKDLAETSAEYAYDWNGNLKKDDNKGVASISYNHLNLPVQVRKSASEYINYTYDAAGRKLSQEVFGSSPKVTDYLGNYTYEDGLLQSISHPEGRIVPNNSPEAAHPWEYQYFLKDHLGNIRVVFSEKKTSTENLATMERDPASIEISEDNQFLNINDIKKVNAPLFNHTNGAGKSYSYRLSGASGEVIGPAKSFAVNPGDIVDLEVFAKYNNPQSNGSGISGLLSALTGAFNLSNTGTGPLDGQQAYNSFTDLFSSGPYIGRVPDYEDNIAPKAFLNYILFDENFIMQDFGFDQVSTDANQNNSPTSITHDLLTLHVKVQQKGYLYIYLSNENTTLVDVYFDDFKITHNTGIEQVSDYYSFGLKQNSNGFERQGMTENAYQFNGKEIQNELGIGWLDYGARMYQPETGRFFSVDQSSESYYSWTPYNYCANNPILLIDPFGTDWFYYQALNENAPAWHWHEGDRYTVFVDYFANGAPQYEELIGQKSVVVFNGSRDEQLASDGKMTGEGAVAATVTVYGPGGADDVHEYTGFTMTSDANAFTPIDEGEYVVRRRALSVSTIPKHYGVYDKDNTTSDQIRTMDGGINNNTPSQVWENGEGYKDEIFIHRTNNSGYAGTTQNGQSGLSTGCLLINAVDYNGANGFDAVLSPVGNGVNFKVILNRQGSDHNPVLYAPVVAPYTGRD